MVKNRERSKPRSLKRGLAAVVFLAVLLLTAACGAERVDTLTYAVFPYLPDVGYYQQLIERRWAELEPDIKLIRAEWDCYEDGAPEGIDVVMYDAVMRNTLIDAGWIAPIRLRDVRQSEDYFPAALEGFTVGDELYGIPVFLCGNFLIYDRSCEALATAEHLTDLSDEAELLVANTGDPVNRPQYVIEAIADTTGEVNPSADSGAEDSMRLLDRLAIDAHEHDDNNAVTAAYDDGIGQGYIGFSESMCLLKNRMAQTAIKSISFGDRENICRVYADAAAVTAGRDGLRYEKCVELLNVMAEADVLTALSVRDGVPQCLMLARKAPYPLLAERFPIYEQLESLACSEKNHVILTP